MRDLALIHAPGAGFGYTNASTVVTGLLVERITGLSWDEALRQRLLDPAGLERSRTFVEDVVHDRFAVGHAADSSVIHHWALPRSLGPSGSTLCSPAGDLVRFAQLFLDPGPMLGPAMVKQAGTPQVQLPRTGLAQAWGLGPMIKTWSGRTLLGHSGTNTGGSSYLLWMPDLDLAVATVVNTPHAGYPFAAAVWQLVFPPLAGISPPPSPVSDPSIEVDPKPLVGRYAMHDTEVRRELAHPDDRRHRSRDRM